MFFVYAAYVISNPVSPLETVTYNINDKEISITYSRPFKKGRLIFGNESESALVPFDKYWRTGANRHTVINTNSDLNFKFFVRFCAVSDYAKELLISVSPDGDTPEIHTKNQLNSNFIQSLRGYVYFFQRLIRLVV